jgi:hypothetical protein
MNISAVCRMEVCQVGAREWGRDGETSEQKLCVGVLLICGSPVEEE